MSKPRVVPLRTPYGTLMWACGRGLTADPRRPGNLECATYPWQPYGVGDTPIAAIRKWRRAVDPHARTRHEQQAAELRRR